MTTQEILKELKNMGDERIKATFIKHGASEPLYGVKVGDMKQIVKKVKKDHTLSLELYDSGISDAMYLAGLIADENQITKEQLQTWVKNAGWYMIREYTVPWVAAESQYGWELGLEWIESEYESVSSSGWSTLSNWIAIHEDDQLDLEKLADLLARVGKDIHQAQNRVRYTMNGFVISCGTHVVPLCNIAKEVAKSIGKVSVNMGSTACKVPLASDYIAKVEKMNRVGKKKKQARC